MKQNVVCDIHGAKLVEKSDHGALYVRIDAYKQKYGNRNLQYHEGIQRLLKIHVGAHAARDGQ